MLLKKLVCHDKMQELENTKIFQNLGPDALSADFNPDYLYQKLHNKTTSIKICLMNNKIVLGIGNIYALEGLFLAKIHPLTIAKDITFEQSELLVHSLKEVLLKSIKAGGTTLRDFVGGDNKPGYFKQELCVYGRNNLPCYKCQAPIVKIKQSGRSSFFCPSCQPFISYIAKKGLILCH